MKSLKKYKFLIKFIIKTALICGIFWFALTFVVELYRMSGNTMFPGVRDGDLGFFYRLDKAYVNDIILYEADGGLHVGRVVAYGTQTVDFPESGGYMVNGYAPFEEVPYETFKGDGIEYPLYIPEGCVFVLNDFRSDSSDSRTYGIVEEDAIHGKLLFLLRRRNF